MYVRDIMSRGVVTVETGRRLDDVARLMLQKNIGSVVVTDDAGRVAGIVTERDFTAREPANPFQRHRAAHLFGRNVRVHGLEEIYQEARRLTAGRLMRDLPASVTEDATVEQVVDLMNRHDVLHVPVLRDGQAVGMVSRHDLLRLAAEPMLVGPATAH